MKEKLNIIIECVCGKGQMCKHALYDEVNQIYFCRKNRLCSDENVYRYLEPTEEIRKQWQNAYKVG